MSDWRRRGIVSEQFDLSEWKARVAAAGRSFTCPRCGMISYHPGDVAERYCASCHDWTGVPPEQAR